jgi:hypothetical protein
MMFVHLAEEALPAQDEFATSKVLREQYLNPDMICAVTVLGAEVVVDSHEYRFAIPRNSKQGESLLRFLDRNGGNF